MKDIIRKIFILSLAVILSLCVAACGSQTNTDAGSNTYETEEERTDRVIIKEMVLDYGYYPGECDSEIEAHLSELEELDSKEGQLWRQVMDYWKSVNEDLQINYDVLPDGLSEDYSLCIIVLGYKLNYDGSMQDELVKRLTTALTCAEKYPNAYILCTGGGTALLNPQATEADEMAQWLVENGVDKNRIIIENESQTTAQNAEYSYKILRESYPQVRQIALVTSDKHMPWGTTLFGSWLILSESTQITLVSNAAHKSDRTKDYALEYQAAGLLEYIDYFDIAQNIYSGVYSKPALK